MRLTTSAYGMYIEVLAFPQIGIEKHKKVLYY